MEDNDIQLFFKEYPRYYNNRSVLTKIMDYEKTYNCDITSFNNDSFIELFKYNDWLSHESYSPYKTVVTKYLYFKGAYDVAKNFASLTYKNISISKKSNMFSKFYFINFNEYSKYIQLYLERASFSPQYIQYKYTATCIYLIWIGLSLDDIINLKVSDFDEKNKILKVSNHCLIPHEISEALLFCKNHSVKNGIDYLIYPILSKRTKKYQSCKSISSLLLEFSRLGEEKKFEVNKIQTSALYENIYLQLLMKELEPSQNNINRIAKELKVEITTRFKDTFDEWIKWVLLRKSIDDILAEAKIIKEIKAYWSYVEIRIGQSEYREYLIEKYGGKCLMCSVNTNDVLIASHIKEFSQCMGEEQYDINNGLLLCANHDKLFDRHLISFDVHGYIMISDSLSNIDINNLNIDRDFCIDTSLYDEKYMEHHRNKYLQHLLQATNTSSAN